MFKRQTLAAEQPATNTAIWQETKNPAQYKPIIIPNPIYNQRHCYISCTRQLQKFQELSYPSWNSESRQNSALSEFGSIDDVIPQVLLPHHFLSHSSKSSLFLWCTCSVVGIQNGTHWTVHKYQILCFAFEIALRDNNNASGSL